MKFISLIFGLLLLVGCGTVTPDSVKSREPSLDSSAPAEYPRATSGFLGTTRNAKGEVDGGLLTPNAVTEYNNLISDYRLQYRQLKGTDIHRDDGLQVRKDAYGNAVMWVDAQHLQAFLVLKKWKNNARPDDSLWLKITQ